MLSTAKGFILLFMGYAHLDKGKLEALLAERDRELELLRHRANHLESLLEVSSLINSTIELAPLLNLILTTSEKIMEAEASSIMLLDEEKQELYFEVALGKAATQIKSEARLKLGQGIAGYVAQTAKPRLVVDAYQDEHFNPEYDRKTGFKTRSIICAPLKVLDRVIGVGQVINKQGGIAFDELDLEVFVIFCSIAAVAIDNARIHKLVVEKQGLDHELFLARKIQQSFLPTKFPEYHNLRFAAYNEPAKTVGGDFYQVFELQDGRVGVVLGDVSGKGISAALYATRLLSEFSFYARLGLNPAQTLGQVNEELIHRDLRGMFATILYMILDRSQHKISYANAGHIAPLFVDFQKKRVDILEESSGPPVGIVGGLDYPLIEKEMCGDGYICMLTDGITEARDSVTGEQLGIERVIDVLHQVMKLREQKGAKAFLPQDLIEYGDKQFKKLSRVQMDDMTFVVCELLGWGKSAAEQAANLTLHLPSNPKHLGKARKAVEKICIEAGFSPDEIPCLVLAVDEACTNIIRHAYGMDFSKEIILQATIFTDRLEFRLRDFGMSCDPSKFKREKKDPLVPGGLGCKAMSDIMDQVEYVTNLECGTELILTRKRKR